MSDPAFDNELQALVETSKRLREELDALQQRIERLAASREAEATIIPPPAEVSPSSEEPAPAPGDAAWLVEEGLREPALEPPETPPSPSMPTKPAVPPSEPKPPPLLPPAKTEKEAAPETPPTTPKIPPFAAPPTAPREPTAASAWDDLRSNLADWRRQFRPASGEMPSGKVPSGAPPQRERLELRIGRTWLNRAGAGIFFLAVAFFTKYAFDQGWVSPALQCIGAAAIGLAMVAYGEYCLHKEMRTFATGVLGCGVAVLYLSVYGAHGYYGLISGHVGSAFYMAVTALSVGVSMHGRLLPVAIIAAVGGYATPILLSTGEDRQVELMVYLLALDIGLLACALFRRWDVLRLMAWAGTFLLFAGWFVKFYDNSVMWRTQGFLFAFYALFHVEAMLCLRRESSVLPAIMGHFLRVNNVAFFATTYYLLHHALPAWMGLFAVSTAAVQWLLAWRICRPRETARHAEQALWHDGAAMLALAAPMQFDRYLVSVSWSLQSVLTFWFARRNASAWLRLKGAGVLIAAIAHLIIFEYTDAQLTRHLVALGHWHLSWMIVCFVFSGLCAYGGAAMLLAGRPNAPTDRDLAVLLAIGGTILLLGIFANQWERYVATWWWLGLATLWFALSLRVPAAGLMVTALAFAVFAKVLFWDTIHASVTGVLADIQGIGLNRMMITGVLAAGLGGPARYSLRRVPMSVLHADDAITALRTLTVLIALVITWTGTVEIIRAFRFEQVITDYFANPRDACSIFITGFWAINAIVLWALTRADRPTLTACAGVLLALTVIKYMAADTLAAASTGRWDVLAGIGTNRTFVVGTIVLAMAFFAYDRYRRTLVPGEPGATSDSTTRNVLQLTALLLITWIGTFEIARAFRFEASLADYFGSPRAACGVFITGFWALNTAGLWIAARVDRPTVTICALLLCVLTVLRLTIFDTLGAASSGQWRLLSGIVTNRTFLAGMLVLAVAFFAHARYRRMLLRSDEDGLFHPGVRIALLIAATVLITWVPTFEICRVYRFEPYRERFEDPRLAMHVVLSVFWSLNATGVLMAGFARRIGPLRHLALGLFAITVVKVLFFDLGHLEMVYRIISFAVLGVLLMFASLLYQRLSERLLQPPPADAQQGA